MSACRVRRIIFYYSFLLLIPQINQYFCLTNFPSIRFGYSIASHTNNHTHIYIYLWISLENRKPLSCCWASFCWHFVTCWIPFSRQIDATVSVEPNAKKKLEKKTQKFKQYWIDVTNTKHKQNILKAEKATRNREKGKIVEICLYVKFVACKVKKNCKYIQSENPRISTGRS